MATRYPVMVPGLTVRSGGWWDPRCLPPGTDRTTVVTVDRIEAARELGVPSGAAPALVEKAFRRAARSRHPDVGGDALAFRRATEARAVLLRPRPPDPVVRVVEVLVRYHPVVRAIEAVLRAVDRRAATR